MEKFLGLGIAIGANVAGRIETQHTPAASSEMGKQMVAKSAELEQLKSRMATASPAERAAMESRMQQLEAEKTRLRQAELKAIERKPLWAKPAIFAAAILALFVLLFKNKREQQAAKSRTDFPLYYCPPEILHAL